MDSKGQMGQLVVAVVFLIVFALAAVFVYQASDDLNNALQDDSELSSESKELVNDLNTTYPSLFDGIIAFVMIGLWMLCLVVAYNSDNNPFLLIISLFIIAALGVVGMILNNVWDEVATDASTSALVDAFPITDFLVGNYLLVVLFMGFSSLMVGMYRVTGGFG